MPPEASNRTCRLHGLEVPEETVPFLDRTVAVSGRCPACEKAQKETDLYDQDRNKARERDELRRKMGVPERYLHASLTDLREETKAQEEVGTQVRRFVAGGWGGSPGLLFLGNVGTAKTMMGAALVNHWLEHHGKQSARFYTMLSLLRRVKATWKDSVETEEMAYQRLADLRLLVIDEIGVQFGSQAENAIFTEVINRRYNALHPTILIGNLTLEECAEVLGERVVDRFRDGGHALAFTWPSQRGIPR